MKYLFHLLSLEKLDKQASLEEEFEQAFIEQDEEHPDNSLDAQAKNYALKLKEGVLEQRETLIQRINEKLNKRHFKELDTMTKAILLTGAFEITLSETPFQIVIDESVKLADRFAKKESIKLINGVLDAIAKS